MNSTTLMSFILAVLDDDQGISETAYLILQIIFKEHPELSQINSLIDCTEGRYYLKQGSAEVLRESMKHD